MKKVRVKHEVKSSTEAAVLFCCIGSGVIVGLFMGPVAGFFAGLAGFACGYPASRKEAKDEANHYINNHISDYELYSFRSQGHRWVSKETKLKNIHPGVPFLGRLFFGDTLTKKTTYYLDDD